MQPPEQRASRVRVIQNFASDDAPPAAQRVDGNTRVVLVADVHVGGGHHHHGRPQPRPVPPRGAGGGSGGVSKGGKAAGKADEAWVWIVIAAGVAIGLAATEGARYDGWVSLHPMHPVHLYGPGGYTVVRLFERGYMVNFHKTRSRAARAWSERTRGEYFGLAPSYLLGGLEERNWTYDVDARRLTRLARHGRLTG